MVVKSTRHWRIQNERDILHRFQGRTSSIRPVIDEIEYPSDPPAIVLKYFDVDALHASSTQRFSLLEIKYIAKTVLQALEVLHEDGFVHTGKIPCPLDKRLIYMYQTSSLIISFSITERRERDFQMCV